MLYLNNVMDNRTSEYLDIPVGTLLVCDGSICRYNTVRLLLENLTFEFTDGVVVHHLSIDDIKSILGNIYFDENMLLDEDLTDYDFEMPYLFGCSYRITYSSSSAVNLTKLSNEYFKLLSNLSTRYYAYREAIFYSTLVKYAQHLLSTGGHLSVWEDKRRLLIGKAYYLHKDCDIAALKHLVLKMNLVGV